MSTLCNPYILTNAVPQCILDLTIGTIEDTNSDAVVYLVNTATGRIDAYDVTSDANGLIVLDLTDVELLPKSTYSVTVAVGGIDVAVTIGDETDKQILMPVEYVNGLVVSDVTLTVSE